MNNNTCFFFGHISADPEVRYGQSGTAFSQFDLEINRGTDKSPRMVKVRLKAFGSNAERLGALGAGAAILAVCSLDVVEGRGQGEGRFFVELKVEHFAPAPEREQPKTSDDSDMPW